MAWYDVGSVAVTNNSTTVTGTGTDFISGAQVGEALYINDDLYEIAVINSSTQLTLADPYLGSTASGLSYKIIPTQSLVADLSAGVADLIADFADVRDYAGNGKFNDGTEASPAITFTQDQNNGLYRIGSDNWGLVAGGDKQLEIKTTGVKLDDNKKATFGASDDLEIYHNGSASYIKENGAGSLFIQSNGVGIVLEHTDGTNLLFADAGNQAVTLYNGGSAKLATTATGVDVTGKIEANDFHVTGTNNVGGIIESTHVGGNARLLFKNEGNASEYNIGYNNDGRFTFYDANTTKSPLEIETSGVVKMSDGIATSDITPTDAGAVRIEKSGQNILLRTVADTPNVAGLDIGTPADPDKHRIRSVSNSNDLQIVANGSERMRFHDGKIGINTADPQQTLDVGGRAVFRDHLEVGLNTGGVGLTYNDGGGNANLVFNHTAMIPDQNGNSGRIRVNTDDLTNAQMDFQIATGVTGGVSSPTYTRYSIRENEHIWNKSESNATEAMRINVSGDLLIGKSVAPLSNTGHTFFGNGQSNHTASNAEVTRLNRKGSDGAVQIFYRDDIAVGSISHRAGNFAIESGDVGLHINSSIDSIYPSNGNGGLRDGAINIGYSSSRYKDLYLSGGVYLGGTDAVNKLDDYETGTYVPTVNIGTLTLAVGSYVKVGDIVTVTGTISGFSDTTNASTIAISLPFVSKSGNDAYQAHGAVMAQKASIGNAGPVAYLNDGVSSLNIYKMFDNSNWGPMTFANLNDSSAYIRFTITYQTNA